jgi:aspartyl protease family protein
MGRERLGMSKAAYFALGIMVAGLAGCAVGEQEYQAAGQNLPLPSPLEGETVEDGHLCDPVTLRRAIEHKYPGIDQGTAAQETDHLLYQFGCGPPAPAPSSFAATTAPDTQAPPVPQFATGSLNDEVQLEPYNGVFAVRVVINRTVSMPFILDSGSSEVQLPAEVVLTLIRTGTVSEGDFIGVNSYVLANGSTLRSPRFNIREMRVGQHVVSNVAASVGPAISSEALLGQSFLSKLPSWALDNERHVLILAR